MDQHDLIENLDTRQNDVLDRLAELNARVESLLNECLAARDEALKAADAESAKPPGSRLITRADPGGPICQSPSVIATPVTH
jgi:hypothetical protein